MNRFGLLAVGLALLGAVLIGALLYLLQPTFEQLRDLVVVVYGVLGALLFAILILVAVGILVAVRELTRAVTALIEDPVKPTMNDVRATVRDIKGATEFITDNTVHPLIRVVAIGRGIRRGVSVAKNMARRGRDGRS